MLRGELNAAVARLGMKIKSFYFIHGNEEIMPVLDDINTCIKQIYRSLVDLENEVKIFRTETLKCVEGMVNGQEA